MTRGGRAANALIVVLALVSMATASCAAETRSGDSFFPVPEEIAEIPDIEGVDLMSGEPFALQELRGHVVVVDLWATWCGPCVSELPGLIEFQKAHEEEAFTYVGISVDEPEEEDIVREFAQKKGINYPVIMGSRDVVNALVDVIGVRLTGIPTKIVFGRDGKVAFYIVGSPAGQRAVHDAYLAELATLLEAPIPEEPADPSDS